MDKSTGPTEDGVGLWDWIALCLLFLVGALSTFILWPYYNYTFRFDPEELLATYVTREDPLTMSAIHRELALRIKTDMSNNWRIIQRIRDDLGFARPEPIRQSVVRIHIRSSVQEVLRREWTLT